MTQVTLTVNGKPLSAEVEPRTHLADLLRETHNLTGTHIGCEHGVCGACTILIDGVPARSCITFAVACEQAEITTIEGLDEDEIGAELREAFQKEHGLQCGYCTPGMIVAARDLVLRLQAPSEKEIRTAMSGNLCRCTGYVGIIRAIQDVIAERRARGIDAIPDGGRKALGPAGSGHAAAAESAAPRKETAAAATSKTVAAEALEVDPDWKPQTSFRQSFTVSHSPAEVWAFFGRIADVIACLPGASLTSESEDGQVTGEMRVKAGPIAAAFQGVAQVTRDEASRSGRVIGTGKDTRSKSATRGAMEYRVKPAPDGGTDVEVDVGFTLTGMLAQFGRSGLVNDVANRLTSAFVQNLEARLDYAARGGEGEAPEPAVAAELNAGALLWSVIAGRLKRLFAKLFGRG
ncbi:2Fe-2S iron-sulfur cluster-binding protein [Methyloligella sp. 2.7D]|uniref:xanthine dehydrogenase family Fe-S subunit n=1 Tax=unclassified Methyloligella TaxID=2625955 RepID=UPI00157D01CE|nr:2Fe-2S iron-sulfur cluster-binding protein [Methyloligella sp. GL2]QKP78224.1 SRPBCC family protein [Methyloligella sp. GL2]